MVLFFMEYMYITNEPEIAVIADEIGVDRVWIDLENIGKEERQKNCDSVKSKHTAEDIPIIKKRLKKSKLQVRINPINPSSKTEIDKVLDYGTDIIMLPYYKTCGEVETFLSLVRGRAVTVLLLETKEAQDIIEDTLKFHEVDEIHIGLNDLHLSYKKKFMFELLIDGTVESLCRKIKRSGIPFGFGGIARLGQGMLPAEYILAEHYRLGSTRAILSRSFFNTLAYQNKKQAYEIMKNGIDELRAYEKTLETQTPGFFYMNHTELKKRVEQIVYEGK